MDGGLVSLSSLTFSLQNSMFPFGSGSRWYVSLDANTFSLILEVVLATIWLVAIVCILCWHCNCVCICWWCLIIYCSLQHNQKLLASDVLQLLVATNQKRRKMCIFPNQLMCFSSERFVLCVFQRFERREWTRLVPWPNSTRTDLTLRMGWCGLRCAVLWRHFTSWVDVARTSDSPRAYEIRTLKTQTLCFLEFRIKIYQNHITSLISIFYRYFQWSMFSKQFATRIELIDTNQSINQLQYWQNQATS